MISRFSSLKAKAIGMRRNGASLKDVEEALGIPRSTLSGWFQSIVLTEKQKKNLNRRWKKALVNARKEAVIWHNTKKAERMESARHYAEEKLSFLGMNESVAELALALLYLGEGTKKNGTSMGNSDPLILRFFIACLRKVYGIPIEKIKCELHLRADQNPKKMVTYWSKELQIPVANFGYISLDQRTVGKPTYPHYKGVCFVRGGEVAIQRRLVYIANGFCERFVAESKP